MTEQRQPQTSPPVLIMVGLIAFSFLAVIILSLVWRTHSMEIDVGNDDRVISCADTAHSFEAIRDQLGCYRNSTAQGRAKDALRISLGQGCEQLASMRKGQMFDLGDGTPPHGLTENDLKEAYGLARAVKDSGIYCSDIPRDPGDHTREVLMGVGTLVLALAGWAVVSALHRRSTVATPTRQPLQSRRTR